MTRPASSRLARLAPALALIAVGAIAGGCKKPGASRPKGLGARLVEGPARNLQLTPDGATLAFLADVKPSPESNAPEGVLQGVLTTAPAAGGPPRQLGGGVTTLEDGYRISADGKWIAWLQGFQFRTQSGSLNLAPMPEGETRLVAHGATFYRFSPDGRRLGYVAGGEMHLLDPATGEDRLLAREAATFEFARDGAAVLIRRRFNAGGELLLARLDGDAAPRKLGENVGEYGFSRDGASVAFIARVGGPASPYSLFVGPADGAPRRIGEGVSTFQFSPDGRWIAFIDGVGLNRAYGSLQLAPVSGGAAARVGEDVVEHRWAPDSQAVAIRESHEDARGRVWTTFKVVTLPKLAKRLEEHGPANGFINFEWSADGRHLAYLKRVGEGVTLQLLGVADDQPARVIDQWAFSYQFAPGDRALWYRSNCVRNGRECELLEISVEDPSAKPRRIASGIAGFRPFPDGERLLLMYPRTDTTAALDLGFMELEADRPTRGIDVYTLPGVVFLDPTGSRLAYIVGQRKREGVYVAELE